MSKYAIESTTLTAIGDAIREKTGTEDLIPVPQLASKILEISGGGSGGGDVSVTNGVLKTGTAEQDLQAGNLATFREYDPSFVSCSSSHPTYCQLSYWGSGLVYENNYETPKLKYIVPIGQGHFLFNHQASGTGTWAVGYMGDDNKFHYTDDVLLMGAQSDVICSGVIGFTEEGYFVYGYCYASGNTKYWVCKLNPEKHTIEILDSGSLIYDSSNTNSKFMFNTKLVKLPAKNRYLIVSLSTVTSSYQYYSFMGITIDSNGDATKNGEGYYRYSSSGVQHYLGDVEVVSNTEVRIVTNKGVMKATATNTAWSSVSCTHYAWPDTSLDHFDLISLVKYDDERYLASDGNYLEMFKWSGSAYTKEAQVYINKATSPIGNTMPRAALQSQIFLQEDKTIVFMNISACAVVSYDTSTATFTWHNIVTMPSIRGTLSASYVSFGGRIDENTFYQVRTANDGYLWPILCRVGQDNSISAFDLTASKIKDVTPPSSYQINGYLSYVLSAYCNKISNCYQDGVLFITMPSSNSTSSSTSYQHCVIFKIDKDVIKKGATGWGTPCLVKDNISAGSTGQAYVIE